MKTNSKEVKKAVQSYIMDCISFDGLGYDNESNTLENLAQTFKNEAGKPQRGQNNFEHFKNFVQGLPSWFNLEFYNDAILEKLESWGLPLPSNKDTDDAVNLYYWLIYRELTQMLNKSNLTLN